MKDTVLLFLVVVGACFVTCFMLRALGVGAEERAIWSGPIGVLAGELLLAARPRRRR